MPASVTVAMVMPADAAPILTLAAAGSVATRVMPAAAASVRTAVSACRLLQAASAPVLTATTACRLLQAAAAADAWARAKVATAVVHVQQRGRGGGPGVRVAANNHGAAAPGRAFLSLPRPALRD